MHKRSTKIHKIRAKHNAADKRELVRLITSRKANTATQLVKELKDMTKIKISANTARYTLKDAGMKVAHPLKKNFNLTILNNILTL